jgi:hypothetical protein
MKKHLQTFLLSILIPMHASLAIADTSLVNDTPELTVMQVMMSMITPASNTLWAAENPQTEDEWQPLQYAAISIIASAKLINLGGTGVNDQLWAKDETWIAFSQAMANAGDKSLKAIRQKDIDALFEATDMLLSPCEGCHIQFNPNISR